MAYQVPVEKAALKALAAWLRLKLPMPEASPNGVAVQTQWPDPDKALPARAVSIIYAGERSDDFCQPTVEATEVIHAAVSSRIIVATATNLSSAISVLNACRSSYEAHRISTSAHLAADIANAIAAPAATDQDSAYELAVEMYNDITTHMGMTTVHPSADGANVINAAVENTAEGLVAAAERIRGALNAHYAARIYVWRIRGCEQPVQLDVWSTYDGGREDIIARLEPLLNADPAESAGWDYSEPARNGVEVPLGDGWPGFAGFVFDKPRRTNTSNAQKQSEFRATYSGTAEFWLLIKAQSPRMARIALNQVIGGQAAATATIASSGSGEPSVTFTTS